MTMKVVVVNAVKTLVKELDAVGATSERNLLCLGHHRHRQLCRWCACQSTRCWFKTTMRMTWSCVQLRPTVNASALGSEVAVDDRANVGLPCLYVTSCLSRNIRTVDQARGERTSAAPAIGPIDCRLLDLWRSGHGRQFVKGLVTKRVISYVGRPNEHGDGSWRLRSLKNAGNLWLGGRQRRSSHILVSFRLYMHH
jgi:hypothetical protein